MKVSNLEQKIIDVMKTKQGWISAWSLADIIWDNCMQRSECSRGNGGRLASITKTCWKSPYLRIIGRQVYYSENGGFDIIK